jgi:hypothetical protein
VWALKIPKFGVISLRSKSWRLSGWLVAATAGGSTKKLREYVAGEYLKFGILLENDEFRFAALAAEYVAIPWQ